MSKRALILISVILAVVAGYGGYQLVTRALDVPTPAKAQSVEMPAVPFIVYLAPSQAQRGLLDYGAVEAHRGAQMQSWQEVRQAGQSRALDALLIDAALSDETSASDRAWLQNQFRNGVVMVGLGVDDDQFAQNLGVRTFRIKGEADVPIGPMGYRFTQVILLGQPEDIRLLGDWADWFDNYINGNDKPVAGIKNYMSARVSTIRGQLDTEAELNLLFVYITSHIEAAYKDRALFAAGGKGS